MRREGLEDQLRVLGWFPVGPSGANHVKWAHPRKLHQLYVRQVSIIPLATAERILTEAQR